MPLPPYIAARRAAGAARPRRLSDAVRRRAGRRRRADGRPAFHAGAGRAARERGASLHKVTLHVGAGTFLPVKADDTRDHRMHAEWGRIDAATADALNEARARGRPDRRGRHDVAAAARKRGGARTARCGRSRARPSIFITPGYRFRAVDALLTNFHLPRSTLFMLVARLRRARAHRWRPMRTPSPPATASTATATPAS